MLNYCRKVAYRSPALLHLALRLKGNQPPRHRYPDFWDRELTGSKKFYLSGSLLIRCHNSVVAHMVCHERAEPLDLLDAGCGGGELLAAIPETMVRSYTGLDISRVAVEYCQNRFAADPAKGPRAAFLQSDICGFNPGLEQTFDVIVFNEVLYFLEVEQAVSEVNRYYQWLKPAGRLCVTLKDDPKCRLLYKLLSEEYRVTVSFLGQYSSEPMPQYRLKQDTRNFPFLSSILVKNG